MKLNKLLLLSLAGITLSGCGKSNSIKKYKHEVSHEEFAEQAKKVVEESPLLSYEGSTYSYVAGVVVDSCITRTRLHEGVELSKKVEKNVTSSEVKYDSEKHVLEQTEDINKEFEDERTTSKEVSKDGIQYFVEDKNVYEVYALDKVYYVYEMDSAEEALEEIDEDAAEFVVSMLSMLDMVIRNISEESKCYIDGDVYTVVYEDEEVDEEEGSEYLKNIYQLELSEKEVAIRNSSVRKTTTKSEITEVESFMGYTLTKKNVSVKPTSLEGLIDDSDEE